MSIGLQGERKDVIEYDQEDMTDDEFLAFLGEEWNQWTWNYIDGGITILE